MFITRCNEEIKIVDGYLHKESIKEIEGRRYDAESKAWYIPLTKHNAAFMQMLGAEPDDYLKGLLKEEAAADADEQPCRRMPIRATPYKHQVRAFNFVWNLLERRKGAAVLADMGTGKTLITIAAAGALFTDGRIKRLLVVCPKTIVGVWEQEFAKFADFDYQLAVPDGSIAKKADVIRHMNGGGLQVIVMNYESVWRLEGTGKENGKPDEIISKWKPDMIVCDESSKIKNPTAKQSKALHKLGKQARYNIILTGTPVCNSPLDFFSQYKFLDESIFGKSFFSFRIRHAILGRFNEIVGYMRMPELVEKAHSVAFRIKLEDAVELPEKVDEVRLLELEPNAKRIYRAIDKDSHAELIQGEINTNNVLTRLTRLSQCTGGFIKDDQNKIVQQVSQAKLEVLEDIIETCLDEGKKVVVFARYIPEIDAIEKMLKGMKIEDGNGKKKPIGYSLIKGDVKDRPEQVDRFQTDPNVRVFVGQVQTTSMGLTLTAAHTVVFYSLDFSSSNHEQCRARIYRIGQQNKCLYIYLVVKGTVDEQIMAALKAKKDIAQLVVDDYKTLLGGN